MADHGGNHGGFVGLGWNGFEQGDDVPVYPSKLLGVGQGVFVPLPGGPSGSGEEAAESANRSGPVTVILVSNANGSERFSFSLNTADTALLASGLQKLFAAMN